MDKPVTYRKITRTEKLKLIKYFFNVGGIYWPVFFIMNMLYDLMFYKAKRWTRPYNVMILKAHQCFGWSLMET